jgi:hypothetical protein
MSSARELKLAVTREQIREHRPSRPAGGGVSGADSQGSVGGDHGRDRWIASGKWIVDYLFPRIEDDLVEAGALRFDWRADFLWLTPVDWGGRAGSDIVTVTCTRELLEWVVRRRLSIIPTIRSDQK